jgi:signal transduction histidine kinase
MAERAAHLVDHVLPADVPVRQWVLSVPHRLRYRLAYDHRLYRTVLHIFVRALRSAYRRAARRQGLSGGETGMVTSVQRFGGSVNVHLHFHTLVLDGVFVPEEDGTLRFHPASPPADADVRRVLARVRRRLERLGVTAAGSADENADPLADESAALAGLSRAAILGRAALGRRVGRGPVRIGADPDAPWVDRHVPLHAHDGGFDLHAAVHVAAGDRERLERLCQYLCRPPLGQSRLHRLRDGRIAVALQRPWADGTTHLVFTPLELLERLVPLVPRPRINLVLYHGVLAPTQELHVFADRIQIEQVIVNILQNAIDAIREVTHDTREIRIHTSRTDDGMGEVTIDDTGTGFRAGVAERLYEPFFTTKPRGMGMGLAISRSIVELHQGRLSVTPRTAGAGTTVRLALPLDSPEGGRHDG